MRISLGAWNAADQEYVDRNYPETLYLGWKYNNWYEPATNVGTSRIFPGGALYNYFKSTFGREPIPAFRDADFELNYFAAGLSPAYERIIAKLAAIDSRLVAISGPQKLTGSEPPPPAIDFSPDSPAYAGVNSSTITFNAPAGVTTVTNGVVTSVVPPSSSAAGGAAAARDFGMLLPIAAGLALFFLFGSRR